MTGLRRQRWVEVTAAVLCAGVVFSASALARKGDKNATGRVTEVKDTGLFLIVIGETEHGPLWLGCTFFPDTNREFDLGVRRVRGRFKESFTIPVTSVPEMRASYVVALWRWKVDRSECHRGENGRACKYCVRNGYHLEDRIDRETGTWSIR